MPGANGQGQTKEECLHNLTEAIQLLRESEREEAFRLDPEADLAELMLAWSDDRRLSAPVPPGG